MVGYALKLNDTFMFEEIGALELDKDGALCRYWSDAANAFCLKLMP